MTVSALRLVDPLRVEPDAAPGWLAQAKCSGVDPDLFFPGRGVDTKTPKAICAGCPVRAECLDHAMSRNEKHGIWGGTSERERRRMRRTGAYSVPVDTIREICSELGRVTSLTLAARLGIPEKSAAAVLGFHLRSGVLVASHTIDRRQVYRLADQIGGGVSE